jgi:hypothetical protein
VRRCIAAALIQTMRPGGDSSTNGVVCGQHKNSGYALHGCVSGVLWGEVWVRLRIGYALIEAMRQAGKVETQLESSIYQRSCLLIARLLVMLCKGVSKSLGEACCAATAVDVACDRANM